MGPFLTGLLELNRWHICKHLCNPGHFLLGFGFLLFVFWCLALARILDGKGKPISIAFYLCLALVVVLDYCSVQNDLWAHNLLGSHVPTDHTGEINKLLIVLCPLKNESDFEQSILVFESVN